MRQTLWTRRRFRTHARACFIRGKRAFLCTYIQMFYVHAGCGAFVWVVRQYLLHNEAHVFEYTCTGRAKSINTLIPKHCTQVPAILLSPVASFRVQNVKCPLYNYYESQGPRERTGCSDSMRPTSEIVLGPVEYGRA